MAEYVPVAVVDGDLRWVGSGNSVGRKSGNHLLTASLVSISYSF